MAKKILSGSYHVKVRTVCPHDRILCIPTVNPKTKQLSLRHSILAGLPVRSSFAFKTISVRFADMFMFLAVNSVARHPSRMLGNRYRTGLLLSLSCLRFSGSDMLSARATASFQYTSFMPSGTFLGFGVS